MIENNDENTKDAVRNAIRIIDRLMCMIMLNVAVFGCAMHFSTGKLSIEMPEQKQEIAHADNNQP